MTRRHRVLAAGLCLAGIATPCCTRASADVEAATIVLVAAGSTDADSAPLKADPSRTSGSASLSSTHRSDRMPVFIPRGKRGAPAARVGGASRGTQEALVIHALVPRRDAAALTLAEQPTLYWHISADTPHSVNFTLSEPEAVDPILDLMLAGPFRAGMQRVDLQAHGARLAVGKRFQWFVAVVPDPERRSADIVARGAIQRVAEPELESQLEKAEPKETAGLLARAGIWYDALDVLSDRIEESPANAAVEAQRSALLEQVGLDMTDMRD